MGVYSLSDLGNAIGTAEGYGVPGAIPTLANNPGDLALGDIGNGTMGNGITVFSDANTGQAALQSQLSKIASGNSAYYTPGESIQAMGQTWAGSGQQGANWSNNVSKALGIDPSSSIGKILGTPVSPADQSAIFSGAGAVSSGLKSNLASVAGYSSSRVAAFLIGLICVAGGIYMLKSTRTVILAAGKVAAKIAA